MRGRCVSNFRPLSDQICVCAPFEELDRDRIHINADPKCAVLADYIEHLEPVLPAGRRDRSRIAAYTSVIGIRVNRTEQLASR